MSLRDRQTNRWMRDQTKFNDAIEVVDDITWRSVGHERQSYSSKMKETEGETVSIRLYEFDKYMGKVNRRTHAGRTLWKIQVEVFIRNGTNTSSSDVDDADEDDNGNINKRGTTKLRLFVRIGVWTRSKEIV